MSGREKEPTLYELEKLANICAATFIQRFDLYPKQLDNGSYVCIPEPLKIKHLVAHLRGQITLGTYLLDCESRARFIVLDADDSADWEKLIEVGKRLEAEGVPSHLETSRRGGHLWLFFHKPLLGKEARAFGQGIKEAYKLEGVELYPKQDQLETGPGSLIRLPFGVHRRTRRRYGFVQLDGTPLSISIRSQIPFFEHPNFVPEASIEVYKDIATRQAEAEHTLPAGSPSKRVLAVSEAVYDPLSERIKASISVREFVSNYIALSPTGMGLCPFHDDHNPSFAVNDEGNYWHCFSCDIGGSVIDFWMQWRKCDFTTAIRNLAKILF